MARASIPFRDSDAAFLSEGYWRTVRMLHLSADESVMEAATELLSGPYTGDRVLAADILAQAGTENPVRRVQAVKLLLPALESEAHPDALASMAVAFGHLQEERAVPLLANLAQHPTEVVRRGAAYGLCGQDAPAAIEALITLSADADTDVRNWATFGLGSQSLIDTVPLRDALAARLQDADDETREEALVGLALRGDLRIIPSFLHELSTSSPDVLKEWRLITDAAEAAAEAARKQPAREWCVLLEALAPLELAPATSIRDALKVCKALEP